MKKLVLILIVFSLVMAVDLAHFGVDKVGNIIKPTPLVILPDPVVIVKELQKLNKLETVSIAFERIIRAERDNKRLFGTFGEKMLFVAYGQVIAGIDINKIKQNDFKIIDSDTLKIQLPEAEILHVILDNEKSYVFDREKGIFATFDGQMETAVRKQAQQALETAALDSGILELANKLAQFGLKEFISKLGYQKIIF